MIDITLLPDFPHPNLHPVLRNNDILPLHLFAGFVCDVVCDRVGDVADESNNQEDSKKD